jgi:protein involved in polysaccharide export with SLBB domain
MNYIYNTVIAALFISLLFSQGLSNREIEAMKKEIQSSVNELPSNMNIDTKSNLIEAVNLPKKKIENVTDSLFGYNYFNQSINFYDNIPTPKDYRLGPGDEITISMWGDTNIQKKFTINKEGLIFYSNVGFINISNKTLKQAEEILTDKLAQIYSTLKDENNKTKLTIDLSKIKSINVYFTGAIKSPGVSIIHPFSDIFSAITQVGGIDTKGSLRTVQLIRDGKIVNSYDFYSFFIDGQNTFANTRIIEGDVIHIPPVVKRVVISGAIESPGKFELIGEESLDSLIKFAGGLKASASSSVAIDQIKPLSSRFSDDNARSSLIVNLNSNSSIILNNGDEVMVQSIGTVGSKVEIFGRIKTPGKYPAINTTLKDILDMAGGFEDPIFRKSINEEILVLRQDEKKFYGIEFKISYADAASFKMEVGDKILVYEDINYRNNFTYRIEGEVNKPGTYPINGGLINVEKAISLAGGLTELSSVRNLTVLQEFTEVDDLGEEVITTQTVNNATLDFEIGINSVIVASPIENVVRVEGNVYNPGLITYSKGLRYPRYIELAGGYKKDTLKNDAYIKRANGNIEQVNGYFISRGKNIYPGDTIIVPLNENPKEFDITAFISDLSTTLANIAAILLIVDNQTN